MHSNSLSSTSRKGRKLTTSFVFWNTFHLPPLQGHLQKKQITYGFQVRNRAGLQTCLSIRPQVTTLNFFVSLALSKFNLFTKTGSKKKKNPQQNKTKQPPQIFRGIFSKGKEGLAVLVEN